MSGAEHHDQPHERPRPEPGEQHRRDADADQLHARADPRRERVGLHGLAGVQRGLVNSTSATLSALSATTSTHVCAVSPSTTEAIGRHNAPAATTARTGARRARRSSTGRVRRRRAGSGPIASTTGSERPTSARSANGCRARARHRRGRTGGTRRIGADARRPAEVLQRLVQLPRVEEQPEEEQRAREARPPPAVSASGARGRGIDESDRDSRLAPRLARPRRDRDRGQQGEAVVDAERRARVERAAARCSAPPRGAQRDGPEPEEDGAVVGSATEDAPARAGSSRASRKIRSQRPDAADAASAVEPSSTAEERPERDGDRLEDPG